jgi:hypothetical protein
MQSEEEYTATRKTVATLQLLNRKFAPSDWVQISRSEEGTKCDSEISYPCHLHGILYCAAASSARGASFALLVLYLEFIDVFAQRLQSHKESSNNK